MSKIAIDESKCQGCGICTEVCESGVIELNGEKAYIRYPAACMFCLNCLMNCRHEAIYIKEGE